MVRPGWIEFGMNIYKRNFKCNQHAEKMRGNRLRWFGQVQRRNNEEIRVKGNWENDISKNKWTGVIGEYTMTCRVDKNTVNGREGCGGENTSSRRHTHGMETNIKKKKIQTDNQCLRVF